MAAPPRGDWCIGNTAVSKTATRGSTPRSPALGVDPHLSMRSRDSAGSGPLSPYVRHLRGRSRRATLGTPAEPALTKRSMRAWEGQTPLAMEGVGHALAADGAGRSDVVKPAFSSSMYPEFAAIRAVRVDHVPRVEAAEGLAGARAGDRRLAARPDRPPRGGEHRCARAARNVRAVAAPDPGQAALGSCSAQSTRSSPLPSGASTSAQWCGRDGSGCASRRKKRQVTHIRATVIAPRLWSPR
jgi:hypothetical protein